MKRPDLDQQVELADGTFKRMGDCTAEDMASAAELDLALVRRADEDVARMERLIRLAWPDGWRQLPLPMCQHRVGITFCKQEAAYVMTTADIVPEGRRSLCAEHYASAKGQS